MESGVAVVVANAAIGVWVAYIGPGSGLAISVSLATIVVVVLSVVLGPIVFPAAMLWHVLRRRRVRYRHGVRKVVVLGLDGLDPKVVRHLMDQGKLPHFSALAKQGQFSELETVAPPLTPAAWSSFMTGNDPSYHGIYDFITRDPHTYLPKLSSCEVDEPRRMLRVGSLRIPLSGPRVRMLRQGVPFWRTLARQGLEVTVLRVPITFPPEPFPGRLLSGMCVPDLLGTQGTYTCFGTQEMPGCPVGGQYVRLEFKGGVAQSRIPGPAHPFIPGRRLSVSLVVRRRADAGRWILEVGGQRVDLQAEGYSPWVPLKFRAGPIGIRGMVQFYARIDGRIYMTPLHLDPDHPAMAISYPRLFSSYLAKCGGPFGTLGLIEDTSALNDGVLDEAGFLQQAWRTYAERKEMFLRALESGADDLLICVFDTPDRIQHMFWRQQREQNPTDVIERMMIEMDGLLGQTVARMPPGTLLLVMSDHGFTHFDRSVNLNAWLYQHGYLHLLPGDRMGRDWLQGVDWSRTRAYALGLSGMYINLKGRESGGIVMPGSEYDALVAELKGALEGLRDAAGESENATDPRAIRRVLVARQHYAGPYRGEGPDLIIGYEAGYRCSWECARGQVADAVFADNQRPWSGDHCVDPEWVPGVLLSNVRFGRPGARIVDIAPTILDVFGIPPEAPMQGTSLFDRANAAGKWGTHGHWGAHS
ncbi:MAG: alkaline phosphatase family protein [Bacillota bacterium]